MRRFGRMSPELLLAGALVAVGLLIAAGWWLLRLIRSLKTLDVELQSALAEGKRQAERVAALEAICDAQRTAEHVLETGGSVVREVHRGIANVPFDILEAIPGTSRSAKIVCSVHASITDGVYGALSGLNKAVGRELRKGMKLDEPRAGTTKRETPPDGGSRGKPPQSKP
jgi:hypothetical protein